MRGLTAVLMVIAALLGPPAWAQMQEETLDVPTSRETRAGEQEEIDSEAAAATAGRDWREIASPYDLERIEANPAAYGKALETARRVGSPEDRAELARILADLPWPVDRAALAGDWECRTVRIGGEPAALRVYGWFRCRISELSNGLLLEKLTGSELTSGFLHPDGEARMVYLGRWHASSEPAQPYDGAEGPVGADPANRDDPGILTQRGADRLMLVKPHPVTESNYDLLEFRR